jgi:HAD superfamily hydrolase (TIGR01490 family)
MMHSQTEYWQHTMNVALFDLDNTLLDGDSDYQWGRFLVDEGVVDGQCYEQQNRRFFAQYMAGSLDIYEFARFAYKPLAENTLDHLYRLRDRYMRERIRPMILKQAVVLLEGHRNLGDLLVIITSTNRFITEPIAAEFGVDTLIASEPEFRDGRYTGELAGIPCFQQGKVTRFRMWLEETGNHLDGSWFYSDSHNDIPLLEKVTHPVAVDADEQLQEYAHKKGWPIISLRGHT